MYPKKKFAVLILCAAILCGITGCDEKPNNDPVNSSSNPSSSQEQVSSEENNSSETPSSSEEAPSSSDNNTNSDNNASSDTDAVVDDGYQTDRYIPTVGEEVTEEPVDISDKEIVAEQVAWEGPQGYVIVVPANDSYAQEAADILKDYFKTNAKVELKIVTDATAAQSKEILIGKTNRYTYTAAEGDYFAKVSGARLIFGGGHSVTAKKAVQVFARLTYKAGEANVFSETSDFTATKLGYSYVWGDEFEGTTLDTKRWHRSTKMAATAEMAVDGTDLTAFTENGYLNMVAMRYWNAKQAGKEFVAPWSVTTMETMSYKYGYVEMKAKLPFKRGVWPSFWTSSSGALGPKSTASYTIEVDVIEVFSSTDTLAPNLHKWYSNGEHTQWADPNDTSLEKYVFDSLTLDEEYHTYGFEWTPEKMVMYVDGKAYYTYDLSYNFDNKSDMKGFDTQLYLIFNNHLFTNSSSYKPYDGCEIYSGDLPAEYVIDYVRLYQKNDGISKLYLAE